MKCPNCGRENEKDAKFCAVCGASMEKTEEQKDALDSGVYYGENVPLFRRNGYQKSGAMIP